MASAFPGVRCTGESGPLVSPFYKKENEVGGGAGGRWVGDLPEITLSTDLLLQPLSATKLLGAGRKRRKDDGGGGGSVKQRTARARLGMMCSCQLCC